MNLVLGVNKRQATRNILHDIPNLSHSHSGRYFSGEMWQFRGGFWGPFTFNKSVQVHVAYFHIDEIVRGNEFPMAEYGNNILVSPRIAQLGHSSHLVLDIFQFYIAEWSKNFPRENLQRLESSGGCVHFPFRCLASTH